MNISINDLRFQMQVVVPVTPPDFYRIHKAAEILNISAAEFLRRKLKITSIQDRDRIINNPENLIK